MILLLRFKGLPLSPELLRLGEQELNNALLAVHVAGRRRHGFYRRVHAETAVPERLLRVSTKPDLVATPSPIGIDALSTPLALLLIQIFRGET